MAWRAFILHNFWLKIFSLFFATLIYFAIQPSPSETGFPQSLFPPHLPTLELRCPVAILAAPGANPGFFIQPSAALVKVEGAEPVLRQLTPENIQVYVKLTDVLNPNRAFRVEVVVPRNVTLKEVTPDQVTVQVSKPADK